MNSRERIFNLLQGKPIDRPPFVLTTSLYGANYVSSSLKEYYTDPKLYLMGQQECISRFQSDIVIAPFVLPYQASALGATVQYLPNTAPNIKQPISVDGFLSHEGVNREPLEYILRALSLLKTEYGSEKVLATVVSPPFDLPVLLFGLEAWLNTVLFEPQKRELVMGKLAPLFKEWIDDLKEAGADIIVCPFGFENPRILPPSLVKRVLYPYLQGVFENIGIPIIAHHTGEKMLPLLTTLKGLPNIIGYFIDSHDSFEKCRALFEEDMLLIGNIDGPLLHKKNPLWVEQKLTTIIKNNGKSPFIIGTSAADIPLSTSEETLASFVRVLEGRV